MKPRARRKGVYDLGVVRKVMEREAFYYSESCSDQVIKYGIGDEDVKKCVCALTDSNFRKTHTYDGVQYDDYVIVWEYVDENTGLQCKDRLYIKFNVYEDEGGLASLFLSFHPESMK